MDDLDEFLLPDLEDHFEEFRRQWRIITDAHSWRTFIDDYREMDGLYDIWFAFHLRELRFVLSPDDFSGFLEVTDQGIIDEMHILDEAYNFINSFFREYYDEIVQGDINLQDLKDFKDIK